MTLYTLFGQPASPATLAADPTGYTMGIQFSVSAAGCTLDGIWFYSAPGAVDLPSTIGLYLVSSTTVVQSQAATWSGAVGSGWVEALFTSPSTLTSGTAYKAVIVQAANANWYASTGAYWSSGPGGSGITSGPVTAPNDASSTPGQDSYHSGSLAWPDTSFNASNYWIDVLVNDHASPPGPGPAPVAVPESGGIGGWVMLPVRGRAGSAV